MKDSTIFKPNFKVKFKIMSIEVCGGFQYSLQKEFVPVYNSLIYVIKSHQI